MLKRRLFLIISLMILPFSVEGYNFTYIHPSTGQPIGWDKSRPIQYYLDPGAAGIISNDQIHTLIQEMMRLWENAEGANVPRFEFAGYLPEDVTVENYEKYISISDCYTDDLESCPTETQRNLQTVIILDAPGIDEVGSILSRLCPIGGCAALGSPGVFEGNAGDPGFIRQGFVVLPGPNNNSAKVSYLAGQILHELGHLLGLAHSVVDQEAYIDDLADFGRYIPTMLSGMMPRGQTTDKVRVTLSPDDIAGISVLYPSESFPTETATIKGEILKSDGSPMIHVNVIARNVDDPLCEAYSWLSGRTCPDGLHTFGSLTGGTCYDDSEIFVPTGNFSISGLPPGTYTLEVEEVANDGLGWTLAPGLLPSEDIYGDAEFWNEGDAAGDPSNLTFSTITLAARETRENVDIVLNRSEVTDDRVKYIPLDFFTPGPGIRCPEEPPVDYAEMIGIDEGDDSTDGVTTPSSPGGCSLIHDGGGQGERGFAP